MSQDPRSPDPITRRRAIAELGAGSAALAFLGPTFRFHGSLRAAGRAVDIVAGLVSPATLRLTVLPADDRTAQPVPDDGSLVDTTFASRIHLDANATSPATIGDFGVELRASPLQLRIRYADGPVFQALDIDEATGAIHFVMGRGPLLGMGQGGPQFDRRGSAYSMRSGQGGYQLRTHGGVVPIQWFVSTDGWALYIHHPLGTFDLTGERGRFEPRQASALPIDIFIVNAEPAQIMAEYARLTGRPELPPLWSFGYLQSHRTLSGPEEVLEVARTFREKRLPCDALIYLGTGFTPSGWNTLNGEFDWNPKVFPDPQSMLDRLHAMHYRIVLHIVLEGRHLTGSVSDPCPDPSPGGTGSGQNWPDDQRVGCYWPIHRGVFDQGVDGWWPDQGDGLDAMSRLNRIRMYFEGPQQWRPDERVFALHRNGYAGMARYAAFLWSGDVYSTWETLRTHVPVAINAGLSGIPFWGTDIGGFVPTPEYTGELHVRWFQFGAFCTLFRAHGRTWHLRLPWGWNTGELGHDEIANYRGGAGNPALSELHNADVEPICRKYLELRYRLMPYLYTAVRETHDGGLPVMRALWLHYPDDPLAAARGDEYMWGPDLLVAPVTEPHVTTRRLYLPAGVWYDWWTGERVIGGREIARAVDLETTPLYVRAGAVVPLGPVKQYTAEPVDAPVTLVVHPGADGESSLYEDDGHSFGYQRGEWTRILMRWDDAGRVLTLRLAPGSRPLAAARRFAVRLAGGTDAREITFAGNEMTVRM